MQTTPEVIKDATEKMDGALRVLKEKFSGLRTGKASPSLVDNVQVIYYGTPTRLRDMANISTPEPRTISITPYDPSALAEIDKAILAANLGITPRNDGRVVRIQIPELTEERRKEIVKVAKREAEEARVALRNVRRDANDLLKALEKDGKISEDDHKIYAEEVQSLTDKAIATIDAALTSKEKEILQV